MLKNLINFMKLKNSSLDKALTPDAKREVCEDLKLLIPELLHDQLEQTIALTAITLLEATIK